MLLPASVDDNVVTCHSAEHPCGASALRGLVVYMARNIAKRGAPRKDGNVEALTARSRADALKSGAPLNATVSARRAL